MWHTWHIAIQGAQFMLFSSPFTRIFNASIHQEAAQGPSHSKIIFGLDLPNILSWLTRFDLSILHWYRGFNVDDDVNFSWKRQRMVWTKFGWFEEVALFQVSQFLSDQNGVTWTNHQKSVLTKMMCTPLSWSRDEDQIWIFWACLVQFGLRIMHSEGKCEG